MMPQQNVNIQFDIQKPDFSKYPWFQDWLDFCGRMYYVELGRKYGVDPEELKEFEALYDLGQHDLDQLLELSLMLNKEMGELICHIPKKTA